MRKPPSPVRRGMRFVQSGVVVGFFSLLCQFVITKPFSPIASEEPDNVFSFVGRLMVSNFALLFATPALVTAAALGMEVPPRRLAAAAQASILAVMVALMAMASGFEMLSSPSLWLVWLICAVIGVLLSGFGYDRFGAWLQKRRAASAGSPAGAPAALPSVVTPGTTSSSAPEGPSASPTNPPGEPAKGP